jgi:hypothetical protein
MIPTHYPYNRDFKGTERTKNFNELNGEQSSVNISAIDCISLLSELGKYFLGRMSVLGSKGAQPPRILRLTFCRENTFQAQRGDWQSASSQCHIDLRGHQANLKNKTLTIAIYF